MECPMTSPIIHPLTSVKDTSGAEREKGGMTRLHLAKIYDNDTNTVADLSALKQRSNTQRLPEPAHALAIVQSPAIAVSDLVPIRSLALLGPCASARHRDGQGERRCSKVRVSAHIARPTAHRALRQV